MTRVDTIRAVVLAVGLIGVGCGLFETRTPEQPPPPTQGCRSTTGTVNNGANAVVLNIEDFYGRPAGTTCYSNQIDPAFAFHPDPQDSSQFLPQTPFIAWNDSVEAYVNSAISGAQQSIQVDFVDEYDLALVSTDQNTQTRFWNYQVLLAYKADPQNTLRFTGKADLTMHKGSNGEWKITDWVDHRGGATDSTWGLLRAANRP
jgi:hypothetical protein